MFLDKLNISEFPLYLAPMAGYTDLVFRDICKDYGADVLVSEFVNAYAIMRGKKEAGFWKMLEFSEKQRPFGVQLFGDEPSIMGDAAAKICDLYQPDFIDINYGCPAPKVVNQSSGSSLLRDVPKLAAIASEIVRRSTLPVTAKIRTGWCSEQIVAKEVAHILESEGIELLAIHGRTKAQAYSGNADWELIEEVAQSVQIPVIGNGGINNYADVLSIKENTNVAGVMIGRAALGNPWIFSQIKDAFKDPKTVKSPSREDRLRMLLRFTDEMIRVYDPYVAVSNIRRIIPKLLAFISDINNAKNLKKSLSKISTKEELMRFLVEEGL